MAALFSNHLQMCYVTEYLRIGNKFVEFASVQNVIHKGIRGVSYCKYGQCKHIFLVETEKFV